MRQIFARHASASQLPCGKAPTVSAVQKKQPRVATRLLSFRFRNQSELLTPGDADRARLRGQDIRLETAGTRRTLGITAELRALVERILDVELERPVVPVDARREVEHRVGLV